MGEALGLFAGRQHDARRLDSRRLQAADQLRAVGRIDRLVGDHRGAGPLQQGPHQLARLAEQSSADQHGISPAAQSYVDPDHQPAAGSSRSRRAVRMVSTAALAGRSSVWTVMSASA